MNAHVDPAIVEATRPRDARNNPAVAAAWAEHVARRRRMMPAGPIALKPGPRPYAPQPIATSAAALDESKMVDFAEVLKQYREVTILARRADYPPIDLIIQATAVTFGVTYLDIVSDRRALGVIVPRQVAMFLAKSLTPKSLPEIGRRIGHRDHSTVLHGYRKIGARVQADFPFAAKVASVAAEIAKRWRVAGAAP